MKKTNDTKFRRGCGERGTLIHCWWECKLIQPLWKAVWRTLGRLGMNLPPDPAIPLLGMYPQDLRHHRDTCTAMFISALFTIARSWNQPKCPSTDEWIEKIWYIYTMEFYAVVKKDDIMSFVGKWLELEDIMLSDGTQSQKNKQQMVSLICGC